MEPHTDGNQQVLVGPTQSMGWTEVWRNSSFIAMSPSHHHQFYAFKIHTIVINRQQTELFREFLDTYLHDIVKWHSVQGSDTGSRASLPVFVPSNPETDRMLQHFSDSRKPQTVWWETWYITPAQASHTFLACKFLLRAHWALLVNCCFTLLGDSGPSLLPLET